MTHEPPKSDGSFPDPTVLIRVKGLFSAFMLRNPVESVNESAMTPSLPPSRGPALAHLHLTLLY